MSIFRPRASLLPDPAEPVPSELFSVERLEQHAESLAVAQSVTPDPRGGRPLLPRLKDNALSLIRTPSAAVSVGSARSPRTLPVPAC